MKSVYGQRFWERVAVAMRVGWACLIMGLVVEYGGHVKNTMTLPVFAYVLAIICCEISLGKVLENVVAILLVTVPVIGSSMVVLRVLKPPISFIAAVLCIAISSFVIAIPSSLHILGKKVGLAQVGIVYITAHVNPDMDPVFYPLCLVNTTVLGALASIAAVTLPWPRLAIVEVQKSAISASRSSSEIFMTVVSAFCTLEEGLFSSTCLQIGMLAQAATSVLTDLKDKQGDIMWELRGWGSRPAFKHLTRGLNGLNLHLTGMEMALQSGFVLQSPKILRVMLKECLGMVTEHSGLLLDNAVRVSKWRKSAGRSHKDMLVKYKLVEDGKEILNKFDQTLLTAREKAYYSNNNNERRDNSEDCEQLISEKASGDLLRVKRSFRARVATYFLLFNLRLYFLEAMNLVDAPDPNVRRASTQASEEIGNESLSSGSLETTNLDPVNFLDSIEEMVEADNKTENKPLTLAEATKPGPVTQSLPTTATGDSRPESGKEASQVMANEHGEEVSRATAAKISLEGETLSFRASLGRQCSHRRAVERTLPKVTLRSKIASLFGDWSWDSMKPRSFNIRKSAGIRAFKISLAMTLATVVGTAFLKHDIRAYWAPVTVGFIIGRYQGGSFRLASLRLQGTVLGTIYGYLAMTGLHKFQHLTLVGLIPWVVFSAFLRYSKAYGYMGVVSAFTAAIMMLGDEGSQPEGFQKWALDRITETFIGLLCFVFVETAVFPVRAVVLVREELVTSLIGLRDCVAAIITVYTGHECLDCRAHAVQDIKKLERQLRISFSNQALFQAEAVLEPDLWFVPFPGAVYSKLISIQGRMLDLLFFMVCSLHASTEDCMTSQMEKLLTPLRTSLTALEDEVLSSIDSLQDLLQMRTRKRGLLTSWIWKHVCNSNHSEYTDVGVQMHAQRAISRNSAAFTTNNPSRIAPVRVHPLVVLGNRKRSVDGTPLNLKFTMESFEQSYEDVLQSLIAKTKAEPNLQIVGNCVMLSFSSLTFSLHALLRETVELERTVHELLQAENPWSLLDFWDTYAMRQLWQSPAVQSP